jgi:hypothetical protein
VVNSILFASEQIQGSRLQFVGRLGTLQNVERISHVSERSNRTASYDTHGL